MSAAVDLIKRVAAQAATRGLRVVGYHGDADGRHFRFDFAPIKAPRRQLPAPPPEPRRVTRGVRATPAQGDLL